MSSSIPSATATGKVWPSGISPPLEVVTATDRGGIIAVTTTVALALALLIALPTGMYIRIRSSAYRSDYYIFLAAIAVFSAQSIAVYVQLNDGLGKAMDLVPTANMNRIDKTAYGADILYLITMFLTKCSTASIFLRLTPGRGHSIAVKTIVAGMTAWILMGVFVMGLRCHPSDPWFDTTHAKCPHLYERWAVIGALDIISEFALFCMSIYLVWNVRMALKSKATVVAAFGCRLPIIALVAARLHFLTIDLNSRNRSFDTANTVALTQFEMGYAIFACIMPVMKPFLASHEGPLPNEGYTGDNYNLSNLGASGSGGGKSNMHSQSSQIDARSRSRERGGGGGTIRDGRYNTLGSQPDLASGNGNGKTGVIPSSLLMKKLKLRPEHTSYHAHATVRTHDRSGGGAGTGGGHQRHNNHDTSSLDSGDSQLMIIKKDVDFSVQYDRNPSRNTHRSTAGADGDV